MSNKPIPGEPIASRLLQLEMSLIDSTVRQDSAQVSALLAEDFVEFGSSGRTWTRPQIIELLAAEDYDPPAIEDFQCRQFAENVALATYRTVRTNSLTGERAVSLRSSIWTNISGKWLLRFHQWTRAI